MNISTSCSLLHFNPTISEISALKMEAACSSETLVSTYKTTRRYNPEDQYDIFTAVRTSNLVCLHQYEYQGQSGIHDCRGETHLGNARNPLGYALPHTLVMQPRPYSG
jgi:hypothetical protein